MSLNHFAIHLKLIEHFKLYLKKTTQKSNSDVIMNLLIFLIILNKIWSCSHTKTNIYITSDILKQLYL